MIPGFLRGYLFGGDPEPAIYALIRKTADQAGTGSFDVQTWGADVYDPQEVHSTVSNQTLFIVPSEWNNRYARVSAGALAKLANYVRAQSHKNGASHVGQMHFGVRPGAGVFNMDVATTAWGAPVVISTGDQFRVAFETTLADNIGNDDRTWAQLEIMPSGFNGALATMSAPQTVDSAVEILDWGAHHYDTLGFHSTTTNTSRLTIPFGVSLVRVSGNLSCEDVGGSNNAALGFYKNGSSSTRGLLAVDVSTDDQEHINAVSAPIPVTAGDYFQCWSFNTGNVDIEPDDATWFSIEVLRPDLRYALVYRTSNQVISATTNTIIEWDGEVNDTGGFHNTLSNISRLRVPAGVTRVRLLTSLYIPNIATYGIVRIIKNGTTYIGMGESVSETDGGDGMNVKTSIQEVVEGDYFEVQVYGGDAFTVDNSAYTWFCIEEV